MCRVDPQYEAYVASNVQYQASTDPEYQALLSQRQQLQDPDAEAAMVRPLGALCVELEMAELTIAPHITSATSPFCDWSSEVAAGKIMPGVC